MAFDGTVIRALAKELRDSIVGGRISKISQSEKDEIMLLIRGQGQDRRLMMSANPSLPLICFVDEAKPAIGNAPAFCMLLRKHIAGGRITDVRQIEFERALCIEIEHINEMGDMGQKQLIIEIMGKHSNIILINNDGIILDGIKRITPEISSVRSIMPNEKYFIPESKGKLNPLTSDISEISDRLNASAAPLSKAIYEILTGFSPMLANELCHRAKVDAEQKYSLLTPQERNQLLDALEHIINILHKDSYSPCIYYEQGGKPKDFSAFKISAYEGLRTVQPSGISEALKSYYYEKSVIDRLKQKSSDLRQLINNLLSKNVNKLKLQEKQLSDTDKREKYRLYGELLNAYAYDIPEKSEAYTAANYYDDNRPVKISLDPTLSASKNAQKYFDKYGKAKRTYEALSELIPKTKADIEYLSTILMYLNRLSTEADIEALKEDMAKNGFLKKSQASKSGKSKKPAALPPLHYVTESGRDIYVGRNNVQNDELSFKLSSKHDWWFHSKSVPGSHVIMKANADEEIPDSDYEAAAGLAAFYSSSEGGRVEIDYTLRKNLIKPPSAPSGYVIYHTNYSMSIDGDISRLTLLNE